MPERKEHVNRAVMKRIGQRIREARKTHKIRQEDLAAMFGLEQSRVSEWESGQHSPHISLLPRLAEILQVPIQYFFEEEDV